MAESEELTAEDARKVLQSLRTPDLDDDAAGEFHDQVLHLAARNADLLAREATAHLRAADDTMRVAAVYALGRCAESGPDGLAGEIEGTLLIHAEREQARAVIVMLAVALNHVWNRRDDESFAMQLRCALSEHVALRLAAARALALSTSVPLPALLVPAAERLAADPDPEVRSWAEDALSYKDGWARRGWDQRR